MAGARWGKQTATVTATAPHPADLEPSLVGTSMYVTRRRPTKLDAAALLSIMICLLTLIPAHLIVPGMTDLGRPGLVIGFGMFCWWVLVRFTLHLVLVGPQPIRWAVLALFLAMLVSYAAAFMRWLTVVEVNGADRTMLFFCVWSGVILMAADGIPNWHRLRGVVQVFVWCASFMAGVGVLQYVLSIDVTRYLVVPGLQPKGWIPTFEVRGAGIRVASTASHYIELSTVLALALPFAVHFASFAAHPWRRRGFLMATMLIAAGIATTISRTGILAVAVMFAVLVPVWGWRLRYNIAAVSAGLLVAFTAIQPGLVATLLRLFDDLESNTTFTARTERYPLVFGYFEQAPWLGRGTGTYLPPQYQILDNEWLTLLVSNGVIGAAALAGLHLTAIALAWIALRRSTSREDRHMCAALISTQLMAVVVAGTFDSLTFSTYATLLALTIGLCGAAWRLTHPARTVRTSTTRWFAD